MRSSYVLLYLVVFIFTGCSTGSISKKTEASSHTLSDLEELSWDFSVDKVKARLGEPSEEAFDDKTKTRVIRYLDLNNNTTRSRSHLVFEGNPAVLVQKYVNIYESDPESSLSYWKKKSAPSNLEILTITKCLGHSLETFRYAEISKSQRIEIEHDKVVRVFWQKAPFVGDDSNRCP